MDDEVWRGLSSPIRRRILDLLKEGPRTTSELAGAFPELSRFAVMQHLGVLEESSLVVVRREGRRRLNYLNAVPVRRVYERWVTRLAGSTAKAQLALKRYVEAQQEQEEKVGNVRTIRIENEMRVKAPVERVWDGWTKDQLKWYPHTYGQDRVKRLVFEERVGGQVFEDWGDGAGKLYGHITYFDPQKAYITEGHLGGGILLEQRITLEADGDETIVRASTLCFGEITDDMEEQIKIHGSVDRYEKEFRAYLESA
jgi:DNA-binding transcriptional ArsR family regulator